MLTISDDTIFLSNGGFVVLPEDAVEDVDADTLNEIETLSLISDSLESP